ncbi:hypothetical protein DVJ78_16085 [Humibacter sp. BT305]|nr:hypothetical protein DVJ78_16085 [Humibacter sp. BT305]
MLCQRTPHPRTTAPPWGELRLPRGRKQRCWKRRWTRTHDGSSDALEEVCVERVLIVCGAGASSTFLALRIRAVARERGLDLVVEAGTVQDLDERLPATDALLVGPHLADRFSELAQRAAEADTPAGLLPADAFGPDGAAAATDLLGELLAGRRHHPLEAEHH